ncbi:MAG: hypothetical protein M3O90_00595 [Actinomycetota bacterium]|nr:hypothetical protein [Actinomycetota bacterium]
MRRGAAWGLALPLALVGSQAAHGLAYTLVYPQAGTRALTLFATGHDYLSWLPVVFAGAGAAAAVSLAVTALDAARGRRARHAPAWAFGLVPPAGFVLQELLELSLHTGTFGWRAILAPTFLPGLLLQLPFALAAYVAARLLFRAAEHVGRAFAPALHATRYVELVRAPSPATLPVRVFAASRDSRAPPHVATV